MRKLCDETLGPSIARENAVVHRGNGTKPWSQQTHSRSKIRTGPAPFHDAANEWHHAAIWQRLLPLCMRVLVQITVPVCTKQLTKRNMAVLAHIASQAGTWASARLLKPVCYWLSEKMFKVIVRVLHGSLAVENKLNKTKFSAPP
jgi:hypothetical protein